MAGPEKETTVREDGGTADRTGEDVAACGPAVRATTRNGVPKALKAASVALA
jgi:hypothetical protein